MKTELVNQLKNEVVVMRHTATLLMSQVNSTEALIEFIEAQEGQPEITKEPSLTDIVKAEAADKIVDSMVESTPKITPAADQTPPVVETPFAVVETVEMNQTAPITHINEDVIVEDNTVDNFAFTSEKVEEVETIAIEDAIASVLNSAEVIQSVIQISMITKQDLPTTITNITGMAMTQDTLDPNNLQAFVLTFTNAYLAHLQQSAQPAAPTPESAAVETMNSELAGIVG